MTAPSLIGTDGNDNEIDDSILSQQLREFDCDDEIELYVEADVGLVRVRGTVTETHTYPGFLGSEIANWDTQFSLNLEDELYEEVGDIRSWHVATHSLNGEWSQPRAVAWVQEEDEFIELFTQPVIYIRPHNTSN